MTRLFPTVAVQTALTPTLPLGPPPSRPGCLATPWQPPQTHRHTDIAEDAVPAARSRSHVVMGLHERSEQASGGRCTALPHPPFDVLRPSQRRLEARPECWDGISVSPQAIQEHFSPHSKCLVGLQHTLLASVARGGEEGSRSAIDADLQQGQAAIVYSTTHVRPNTIGESGYRPAQHILITEAIREEGFPKKKNRHPAARLAREHMMPISCGAVDQVEKGAHLALAEYPVHADCIRSPSQ